MTSESQPPQTAAADNHGTDRPANAEQPIVAIDDAKPRPDRDATGADVVEALAGQGSDAAIDQAVDEAMAGMTTDELTAAADAAPQQRDVTADAVITGRIANIGSEDILIDFDGKLLGSMPLTESGAGETYAVGDSIDVAVTGEADNSGLIPVSRKRARQIRIWRDLKVGDTVEGQVTGMNRGGLEVMVEGIRGFIPASQVDLVFLKDISKLLGQTIKADITKSQADEENLVLSRRKYLEREAAGQRDRVLAELEVGQTRRGRVKSITEYGAFVDLGGVDGLLHISDMSWGRIQKPDEVVKVGDEIEVKVIKVRPDKNKISLSLKQTIPDPWEAVAGKYPQGGTVQGRVLRLETFGAFVEIEPGVEALLPVSEMSWTRRVRHPKEIVKEGDTIEAAVLSVDVEQKRMSLSLKQLSEDPWVKAAEAYPVNSTHKRKVVRTTDFGAFVELEDGVDGLVHISELSDQHVKAVTDKVKAGDEVEVRVLGVDIENKRISLSMKPPPREPTPEELARIEKERKASRERRKRHDTRRGGLTFAWESGGLDALDPSKFAKQ